MTQEQKGYLQKFWTDIEKAGDELRNQPMPQLKEEDFFLFKETGNRLIYEGEYFGRRKYLTVFAILSEFGKKQADVEVLAKVMDEICTEKFWALPAHVNFEALDEKTIDLFAAETAQSLMEIVEILGDRLPENTVDRVVKEVTDRVILPFVTSTVPYSWWEQDRCNWAAVCAGSVGMAAIYLSHWYEKMQQPEDDRLPEGWKQSIIDRVCDALQCYLDGMEEDGACTEGLGYFAYGMSFYTGFAQLLYEETQGEVNLMKRPKCDKIALFQQKCYFGGGVSVSFSDGSSKEEFLPGLTAYLKACYPQVITPDYPLARSFDSDSCYRLLSNERNILWLMQYDTNQVEQEEHNQWTYDLLPSAQWMICKDPDGNGYAAKGGNNDENHNHNDIGHFLCVFEGEMLLADLGAGEYTRDYFADGRYGILCNRSLGHSVPIINGMEQCAGRSYAADVFEWNEKDKELTISFAQAYPEDCIQKITRKIITDEKSDQLTLCVTDAFERAKKTETVIENLVTMYEPVIEGNKIIIAGSRGYLEIEVSGIQDEISVVVMQHSDHNGKEQTVYLIQWQVWLDEQGGQCTMSIKFYKK